MNTKISACLKSSSQFKLKLTRTENDFKMTWLQILGKVDQTLSKRLNKEMKKYILLIFLSASAFAQDYTATIREIDKPDSPVLYNIEVTRTTAGDLRTMKAVTKEGDKIVLEEIGIINTKTNELFQYDINQYQTNEVGHLKFPGDKVQVEYSIAGKETKKEFKKPELLTGPPNYEEFIRTNFEKFKKEKSISVNFLVWDRLDTYAFKVTYLGEQELNGEKSHVFKMNVDNFLIAAFVSPIKVWFTPDLTKIRKFSGRVGVKKKVDGKFKDVDADVVYTYK